MNRRHKNIYILYPFVLMALAVNQIIASPNIFYIQDKIPVPYYLLGKVKSNQIIFNYEESANGIAHENSKHLMIAQLAHPDFIQRNKKLYIIELEYSAYQTKKANLIGIIDEFDLKKNSIMGPFVQAKGHFINIDSNHYIAQPIRSLNHSKQAFFHIKEAESLYEAKQFRESLRAYKRALALDVKNANLNLAIARNYISLQKIQDDIRTQEQNYEQALIFFKNADRYTKYFNSNFQRNGFYIDYMEFLGELYKNSTNKAKDIQYLHHSLEIAAKYKKFILKLKLDPLTSELSENLDSVRMRFALIKNYYYLILHYQSQSSPLERKYYDTYNKDIRQLLKEFIDKESLTHQKEYLNLDFLRISLLYYTFWYNTSPNLLVQEIQLKKGLYDLIFYILLPQYRLLMQNTPLLIEDKQLQEQLRRIK